MNRWRAVGLAVTLAVLVTAQEAWVLGLPYARYFRHSAQMDSWPVFGVHVLGVLAIAALQVYFFWAALISSRRWQVLYLSIFTAAVFIEYGYGRAVQRMTNAHDFDVAFQNMQYWRGMAGAFFDWRAAIPAGGLALALLLTRPVTPAKHARLAASVFILTFGLHSLYAANGFLRRSQDVGMSDGVQVPTGSLEALLRAATMFVWNHAASAVDYHARDQVGFQAPNVPIHHVVLVIDESISAGHLSLNGYPRATTPWLSELAARGKLTNWGVASAATNNSIGSVLCMLTGVNRLPDRDHLSLKRPTIFQYAKAMNYQTHLLEGEAKERRFGFSWDDLRFVDDFRTTKAFGNDPDVDFRIAQAIADLLKASSGQFVVVLKRGDHFPHQMNYPAGRGEWKPSNDERVPSGAGGAALTNTYDNGIRYNLDAFFRAVLAADGSLARTVLLYTSDHGEVLSGEGTEPISRALVWGETAVPLFMVGDDRPVVDTGYRPSHHNIFQTLLDLLGVPPSPRPPSVGRSLLTARASDIDPRPVFGGFLLDEDGYETGDFDRLTRPASLGVQPGPAIR